MKSGGVNSNLSGPFKSWMHQNAISGIFQRYNMQPKNPMTKCQYFGHPVRAARLQQQKTVVGRKSGRERKRGRPRKSWIGEVDKLMWVVLRAAENKECGKEYHWRGCDQQVPGGKI